LVRFLGHRQQNSEDRWIRFGQFKFFLNPTLIAKKWIATVFLTMSGVVYFELCATLNQIHPHAHRFTGMTLGLPVPSLQSDALLSAGQLASPIETQSEWDGNSPSVFADAPSLKDGCALSIIARLKLAGAKESSLQRRSARYSSLRKIAGFPGSRAPSEVWRTTDGSVRLQAAITVRSLPV
jgi:hypothetical protein